MEGTVIWKVRTKDVDMPARLRFSDSQYLSKSTKITTNTEKVMLSTRMGREQYTNRLSLREGAQTSRKSMKLSNGYNAYRLAVGR